MVNHHASVFLYVLYNLQMGNNDESLKIADCSLMLFVGRISTVNH